MIFDRPQIMNYFVFTNNSICVVLFDRKITFDFMGHKRLTIPTTLPCNIRYSVAVISICLTVPRYFFAIAYVASVGVVRVNVVVYLSSWL